MDTPNPANAIVVNCDRTWGEMLARVLEEHAGIRVDDLCWTGDEGYRQTLSRLPDLVVTCLALKTMSGDEMIRAIRRKGISTRILVVSAQIDGEERAMASGADGFLAAPVSLADLLRALEK